MDIEKEIVDFIECYYECKFTGKVKLTMLNDTTYSLALILSQVECPIHMTFEGSFDDFCKFITTQIKQRRLTDTQYFTGYKHEPRRDYEEN